MSSGANSPGGNFPGGNFPGVIAQGVIVLEPTILCIFLGMYNFIIIVYVNICKSMKMYVFF